MTWMDIVSNASPRARFRKNSETERSASRASLRISSASSSVTLNESVLIGHIVLPNPTPGKSDQLPAETAPAHPRALPTRELSSAGFILNPGRIDHGKHGTHGKRGTEHTSGIHPRGDRLFLWLTQDYDSPLTGRLGQPKRSPACGMASYCTACTPHCSKRSSWRCTGCRAISMSVAIARS